MKVKILIKRSIQFALLIATVQSASANTITRSGVYVGYVDTYKEIFSGNNSIIRIQFVSNSREICLGGGDYIIDLNQLVSEEKKAQIIDLVSNSLLGNMNLRIPTRLGWFNVQYEYDDQITSDCTIKKFSLYKFWVPYDASH